MTPLDAASALTELVLYRYSLMIILRGSCSGTAIPTKQKEQLTLFGIFQSLENKAKIELKTELKKKNSWTPFTIGFFIKKRTQNDLLDYSCLISVTSKFLNMLFHDRLLKNERSFFPCSGQMLIDLVECQRATKRETRGQELVWICPFRLTLQLIDERACAEPS